MKNSTLSFLAYSILLLISPVNEIEAMASENATEKSCVIILHGLVRSFRSMQTIEQYLSSNKLRVINIDYPSTNFSVESLSRMTIPHAIKQCNLQENSTIHFVSHSMGGLLIRQFLSKNKLKNLGRVVMLAPPNQGSELIDLLKNIPVFSSIIGPAGSQLGTRSQDLPNQLGAVDFPLGIIAGNVSYNLLLSQIIPGEDDGKVSVKKTKVAGMTDFIVLPQSHIFIMKNKQTMYQTLHFLEYGKFDHNNLQKIISKASNLLYFYQYLPNKNLTSEFCRFFNFINCFRYVLHLRFQNSLRVIQTSIVKINTNIL